MRDPSIFRSLASPRGDEPSARAALALLEGPDPDGEIDRLYPRLVRHKTLLTAIGHLERSGADLDALTVGADLFRAEWPLGALIPMPPQTRPGRIPLRGIRTGLETYRALLRTAVRDLMALTGPDAFLLTFGLGLEAAFPGYRDRMSYDVDLYSLDLDGGLGVLRALTGKLGHVLYRCRLAREDGRWLGVFNTFHPSRDGYELHVDVSVAGLPTGPGLLFLWFDPPLWERARVVRWGERMVRVPSPEDMLLMTAAVKQRKAEFIRRDFNDAWMVVSESAGRLDWDHLCRVADLYRLRGALTGLLDGAERAAGRDLIPTEVRRRLAPGRLERRFLLLTTGDTSGQGMGQMAARRGFLRRVALKLWPSGRAFGYARARAGTAGAVRRIASNAAHVRRFRSRARAVRSGRGGLRPPIGRPAFGSLCEVRPSSPPGDVPFCLSRDPSVRANLVRKLDPESVGTLRAVSALLPDREGDQIFGRRKREMGHPEAAHRCRAFLFSVDRPGRSSTARGV